MPADTMAPTPEAADTTPPRLSHHKRKDGTPLPGERGTAPNASGRATKGDPVLEGTVALYALTGTLLGFLNTYDGAVVVMRAETMGQALVTALKPYPEAYKVLARIVKGNAWTVVFMAHLAPAVAIAANHGLASRELPEHFHLPAPPVKNTSEAELRGQVAEAAGAAQTPMENYFERMQGAIQKQQENDYRQGLAARAAAEYGPVYEEDPNAYANGNGAGLGMASVGGLGDMAEVAARAGLTQSQMANIVAEARAKAARQQQTGLGGI